MTAKQKAKCHSTSNWVEEELQEVWLALRLLMDQIHALRTASNVTTSVVIKEKPKAKKTVRKEEKRKVGRPPKAVNAKKAPVKAVKKSKKST